MEPMQEILSRKIEPVEYEQFLIDISRTAEECVNYGTYLIMLINENHKNSYGDLTILMLFRHIVDILDGCSILIRQGCIDPMEPLLRSIFEASLCIEYILKQDTEKRALAYQVSYIHEKIKSYKRADIKTPEGKQFREALLRDKTFGDIEVPNIDSIPLVSNLEGLLDTQEYVQIEKEWQKAKKKRKNVQCIRCLVAQIQFMN